MEDKALIAIVLFPLIGAIVNGLLGRGASRSVVHAVAVGSVAASFLVALGSFSKLIGMRAALPDMNAALSYTAYEWFSLEFAGQTIPINVTFVMDALSGVMALVVTGIGLLIHIYSMGYMSEEKSYARFFSYLNLFTASMLILILGSNLPLMFVGWEGVGLCSYLLIGFWWENPTYAAAGRKAFVANRIGDFGVLIGMFLLAFATGSFEFAEINDQAGTLTQAVNVHGFTMGGMTIATAACLFLFLGCAGKSAQIPLFVWLPDAMAGPTPVSALIHAATMVTSGLYLICRLSPVFAVTPSAMAVIAVTGALTALLAATIGCVQNDIKKVLAYSTVSQLGFMFAAAGCGAFAASFFHVFTHAFFKACLFLGAGSVMHAVGAHGDADIRRLGGLRKYMPRTHWTFLVSCLAIAGVPGFSGFFSKDEILVGALSAGGYFGFERLGDVIFFILFIAATMTAFYMFRLYFLTFAGEYRGGPVHEGGDHGHHHGDPHESPETMTWPLVLLGAGAVFVGYFWVGILHFDPWVAWLRPALGDIGAAHTGAGLAMVVGTTAAAAGIGLAYYWYRKPGDRRPRDWKNRMPQVHAFVFDKWRVDEFYDATILAASRGLGMLSANFDKVVVDGGLTRVPTYAVQGLGFLFTRLQNGLVHAYGAAMVVGMVWLGWWFTFPHATIETEGPQGASVAFHAGAAPGYEYRWDFDSDGEPDTDWSADPRASHNYADGDYLEDLVVVLEGARYGDRLEEYRLSPDDEFAFDTTRLGLAWRRSVEDTLPFAKARTEGLFLRVNGAKVRKGEDLLAPEDEVVVSRGEHVDVGQARLSVRAAVRATLHVRNAFGLETHRSVELTVPEVKERVPVQVVGAAGGGS